MEYEKEAEIINFPSPQRKKKPVTACSFCKKPLIKGKYVQEDDFAPAICLECVKICSSLMGM